MSEAWNRHTLLTSAEMRRAEQITFSRGTKSFDLMQRAGEAVATIIRERYQPCRVLVLCGPGNNGGDGFIIAESLRRSGWDIRVAAITPLSRTAGEGGAQSLAPASDWEGEGPHPLAPRARSTLSRFAGEGNGDAVQAAKNWQGNTLPLDKVSFNGCDLVIDALFGIGLARPVEGKAREVLENLAKGLSKNKLSNQAMAG